MIGSGRFMKNYEGARTIDGIRVDYDEGWGLIRASNTSPVLSLRFEAESTEALVRIKNTFQTAITHIDPELTIP